MALPLIDAPVSLHQGFDAFGSITTKSSKSKLVPEFWSCHTTKPTEPEPDPIVRLQTWTSFAKQVT